MKEQWKPVEGYENYMISNLGRVKSLNYKRTGKEKLLSPIKNRQDYLFVILYKNGVGKSFRINRLVWQTFVGEIPDGLQVNHIDENKENNRLENLNLMTSKENNNWGTRNSRMAAALSKPVEAIDKVTGRVVYVFPSTAEAGRQGFHQGHISECCNGELKSYKGFVWRYKKF